MQSADLCKRHDDKFIAKYNKVKNTVIKKVHSFIYSFIHGDKREKAKMTRGILGQDFCLEQTKHIYKIWGCLFVQLDLKEKQNVNKQQKKRSEKLL